MVGLLGVIGEIVQRKPQEPAASRVGARESERGRNLLKGRTVARSVRQIPWKSLGLAVQIAQLMPPDVLTLLKYVCQVMKSTQSSH